MTAPITGFNLANSSWRNWVGNQSCVPAKIVTASQEQDVVDAVREARRSGLRLRTPGTGHSFAGVACTDGILLDTRASQNSAINAKAGTATAKAHASLPSSARPCGTRGRRCRTRASMYTQTIAGAVATSTHGSGLDLGSFSSILTACRLVNGEGSRVKTLAEMAGAKRLRTSPVRVKHFAVKKISADDKTQSRLRRASEKQPGIVNGGRRTTV